jgi:hypothetical protein
MKRTNANLVLSLAMIITRDISNPWASTGGIVKEGENTILLGGHYEFNIRNYNPSKLESMIKVMDGLNLCITGLETLYMKCK